MVPFTVCRAWTYAIRGPDLDLRAAGARLLHRGRQFSFGLSRASALMRRSTVLVVEDDPCLRSALLQILTHRGYDVLEAAHGQEGLLLAHDHLPALILTDLAMPILDGWGMIGLLRSDPLTAAIPVIAMSAHPDADLAQGFDVVLPKPTRLDVLLGQIKQLLDRGAPEVPCAAPS